MQTEDPLALHGRYTATITNNEKNRYNPHTTLARLLSVQTVRQRSIIHQKPSKIMKSFYVILLVAIGGLFAWRYIKKKTSPDELDRVYKNADDAQVNGVLANNNTIDAIPPLFDYRNVLNAGVTANAAYAMFSNSNVNSVSNPFLFN